jgi:hypothetical protein
MNITVKRIAKRASYTIGRMYINGIYFCDTCEDTDRGLTQYMSLAEIKRKKIYSRTAIPTGTYNVTMNIVSPRFSKRDFYKKNCDGGRIPRLLNVPGFDGVLIHVGNSAADSNGCLLVGKNSQVGKVLNSTNTFLALYKKLKEASLKGEKITITIQ